MRKTVVALFSAILAVGVTLVGTAFLVGTLQSDGNTYQIRGIDRFVATPSDFTVEVNGSGKVCEMSFAGQSRSQGPWIFTFNPLSDDGASEVTVVECDGTVTTVATGVESPYVLDGAVIFRDKQVDPAPPSVRISNKTGMVAIATLMSPAGELVGSVDVPAGGSAQLPVPDGAADTTVYPMSIASADGLLSTDTSVTVAKGWAAFDIVDGAPLYPPCSTLTWAYDPAGEPSESATFESDIQPALDRIAKNTGLTFVRTGDFSNADIRLHWDDSLDRYTAALGGTSGEIRLSTKAGWLDDRFAGLVQGGGEGATSGRGWLVIHETLHVLGFTHVSDPDSIMNFHPSTLGRFSKGDVQGMRSLYRAHCTMSR